jgi:REP element-mobilizing transposase RayT
MARPDRLVAADAIYHLTCRGVRKLPIFHADRDRALFLALLRETLRRFRWRCQAYCLMDNHYHVVAQTDEPTLSVGMRWLNTAYARTFNKRQGYEGHLFDRRFRVEAHRQQRAVDAHVAVRGAQSRSGGPRSRPRRLALEQLSLSRGPSRQFASQRLLVARPVWTRTGESVSRVGPVRYGRRRRVLDPCARFVTLS